MKKSATALTAFLAISAAAFASPSAANGLEECRAITDSLARLTCYDRIPVEGASPAAASTKPSTSGAVPVTFVSAELRLQGEDYDRSIFSPRIELVPTFKNTSKKAVVAISHRLVVKDAFGDTILENADKLDIRIPAGETVRSSMFYLWEDNQFIRDQPYDRLVGPVTAGTAKAESTVTAVIYEDGSSETF